MISKPHNRPLIQQEHQNSIKDMRRTLNSMHWKNYNSAKYYNNILKAGNISYMTVIDNK